MKKRLEKIVNHYGIIPQLKYFGSEVFELTEAVIRYDEAKENYFEGRGIHDKDIPTIDHIKEEIADVMVLLEQIRLFYDISDNEVKSYMDSKIERQLKRIEDSKK